MAPLSQGTSHSLTSPLQCNIKVNASGMSFVTAHNVRTYVLVLIMMVGSPTPILQLAHLS